MDRSSSDDASLVRCILAGRRDDFEALVDRHCQTAYAVAYSRTGNRADAQDIAQEAFLRAFTALDSLRDPARFAPWLISIVRNTSSNLSRSRKHEQEGAAAAAEPAVDPDVERRDLHEILRRELRQLDEDDREVLVMHYFTGLSTREIADTLGITRENAKKRLQRAREALSERLLAELGPALETERAEDKQKERIMGIVVGMPATWSKPGTALSTSTTIATTAGISAAWKLSGLIAVAVVCVVVAFTVLPKVQSAQSRPPERSSSVTATTMASPAPSTKSSAAAGAASVSTTPSAAPGKTTTTTADATGDAMLLCEVLDSDGKPLDGVSLHMQSAQSYSAFSTSPVDVVRSARTDSRGWAIFDNIPTGWYEVVAESNDAIGYARTRVDPLVAYNKARIVLQPAGRVKGHVQDERGAPVENALVSVKRFKYKVKSFNDMRGSPAPTRTDEKGDFVVLVPPQVECSFTVQAEGFATATTATMSTGKVTVEVTRGETATLRVTKPDGAPLTDATLRLVARGNQRDAAVSQTDVDGVAHFGGLNATEYAYHLDSPDYMAAAENTEIKIETGSGNAFDIATEPSLTLSGRVMDIERKIGVAKCVVEARQGYTPAQNRPKVSTDNVGNFIFTGLQRGSVELRIVTPPNGYVPDIENTNSSPNVEIGGDAATPDPLLQLHNAKEYGGAVTGRVLREDGSPAARVFVRVVDRYRFAAVARTDAQGAFRLAPVPISGDIRLGAFTPGWASTPMPAMTVTADGLNDVEIVIKPTGSIAGRVVADSGQPIHEEGPMVSSMKAWPVGAAAYPACDLLNGDAFLLTDLPAGEHRLLFELEEWRNRTGIREPGATVTLEPGGRLENVTLAYHDVVPKRPASTEPAPPPPPEPKRWKLTAQVVRADSGAPLTEFRWKCYTGRGTSYSSARKTDGRFDIDECTGRRAILVVTAPGYRPATEVVDEPDGATANATVKLLPGAIVTGAVVDVQGKPVQGAQVFIGDVIDEFEAKNEGVPTTAANGEFRFDTLDAKPITLYALHPAFAIGSAKVTPSFSDPVDTQIVLTTGGRIEGIATLNGKPIANPGFSYYTEPFNNYQKTFDGNDKGEFALDHVTPGVLSLAAFSSKDYTDKSRRVQIYKVPVREGETSRINVEFAALASTIDAHITVTGLVPASIGLGAEITRANTTERFNADNVEKSGDAQLSMSVPAGEVKLMYTLQTANRTIIVKETTITVPEAATVPQEVAFNATCKVHGTVRDAKDTDFSFVAALPGDIPDPAEPLQRMDDLRRDAVAIHFGNGPGFTLEGLEPGTYTLRIAAGGNYLPGLNIPHYDSAVVTLTDGADEEVNFELR